MAERIKWVKICVVALLIGAILCLHYFTRYKLRHYQAFFLMLFYVPLMLGSFWFGLKGALSISACVSVIYLHYVVEEWQGLSFDNFDTILEGVIFIAVSFMLGLLVEKERKQHRALVQAEGLAAVGRAASEAAHDMKTPLMAIGGFASQVERMLDDAHPGKKKLSIVLLETRRLESMVGEMLEFGRPLELALSQVGLNEIILDCLAVSEPLAKEGGIELVAELAPSLPGMTLDAARMRQVILNLIANAVQASPEGERVVIGTVVQRNTVLVNIADCGCGIREEDRQKIFEPFFSTKKKGTGLGLAIVKKVVEAHGGAVTFHPNRGKGVTFIIRMPA